MHGLTTRLQVADGLLVAQQTQDCTPILEAATRRRLEGVHGTREMRHAASLPQVVVERYMQERGISFAEFVGDPAHCRAMLNDPALAGFRIWEGKV